MITSQFYIVKALNRCDNSSSEIFIRSFSLPRFGYPSSERTSIARANLARRIDWSPIFLWRIRNEDFSWMSKKRVTKLQATRAFLLFLLFLLLYLLNNHINSTMWPEFACSANQHSKSTIKKKSPQTFAHLANFSKNVSAMFDNHTILLFCL